MSILVSSKLKLLDNLSQAYTRTMYVAYLDRADDPSDGITAENWAKLLIIARDIRRQIDTLRPQVGKEWQESAQGTIDSIGSIMPSLEAAVTNIHNKIAVIENIGAAINALQQIAEIAAACAI